jgi:hypothetical protein
MRFKRNSFSADGIFERDSRIFHVVIMLDEVSEVATFC